MPPAPLRLFVAAEISPAVREAALAVLDQLRAAQADVKWVAPDNLHWTLNFLGDVPAEELEAVGQAVLRGAAQIEPFSLETRGVGAFPTVRRPRTVWLGAGAGLAEMKALHKALEWPLQKLGYRRDERAYAPHLTIGRVRSGPAGIAALAELIQQRAELLLGLSPVERVVLFSSDLRPEGPLYTPLVHAPLGGTPRPESA